MKKLKPVGAIIREMSDLINWTPGSSVVYPNTRYSKTEKVIDYKVDRIKFAEQDLKIVKDMVFAELTKEGYPINKASDIFVYGRQIRFQVRYAINEITLK